MSLITWLAQTKGLWGKIVLVAALQLVVEGENILAT